MLSDPSTWLVGTIVGGAWLAHRLLRALERRGWLYYLGLDLDR